MLATLEILINVSFHRSNVFGVTVCSEAFVKPYLRRSKGFEMWAPKDPNMDVPLWAPASWCGAARELGGYCAGSA
jgi:hypothetical protein